MNISKLTNQPDVSDEDIRRLEREYVLHTWTAQNDWNPPVVVDGSGCYLREMDGSKILDFKSTSICSNLGHAHPKVNQAIIEQLGKVSFSSMSWASFPRMEFARRLAEVAPQNLQKTLFTVSGAEAIENALKIARLYTGKQKVITRYRSYHGASAGAMSLGGDPRRWAMEPGIPGIIRALDCYCYRCPFGLEHPSCKLRCADHFADLIELEGADHIAAVLVEPITGSSGIFVPPDGYLAQLKEICTQNKILLIFDEVMVGLGRTGKWFASEHWNVQPDMMTLAKSLTGGYIPLGALMVSREIGDYFGDRILYAGLTFSGHDLGCAAGIATLQAFEEENLIENSRILGEHMTERLQVMKEHHPSIGDVRGLGLYQVVELVWDRSTRERLSPWTQHSKPSQLISRIVKGALEKGVSFSARWNYVFLAPPLIITHKELDYALDVLDELLIYADDELKGKL
jgi:taurine---2-oxoglutarate transaminase